MWRKAESPPLPRVALRKYLNCGRKKNLYQFQSRGSVKEYNEYQGGGREVVSSGRMCKKEENDCVRTIKYYAYNYFRFSEQKKNLLPIFLESMVLWFKPVQSLGKTHYVKLR